MDVHEVEAGPRPVPDQLTARSEAVTAGSLAGLAERNAAGLGPWRAHVSCLLSDAATTDPTNAVAWAALVARSRALTVDLCVNRSIPSSLVVAVDDPPVVVQRTLARIWRHLDG